MKRRIFVGGGLLTLAGIGDYSRRGDAEKEAARNAAANMVEKQARAEQAAKNQSVLDPVYSVDKLEVKEVKDDATGLTRPEIAKKVAISAGELTVTNKNDENDNKIFVLANAANQTIKPKGGYNKIMLMPPLDFGKKIIDGSGAGIPADNELNIDARILAYYTGTVVMRDGDDVVVKFVKAGKAPNDKTPAIVMKNQCAKDGKGTINQFGMILPDGTVQSFGFVNADAVKRSLPWETAFKEMGNKAREAIRNKTDAAPGAPDEKVGTLEELLEEYRKQAEALSKQIADAKTKKEAPDNSKLTQAEKDLFALNEKMKGEFAAQIAKDERFLDSVTGIAFQTMVADVKQKAAEAEMSSPARR